MIISRACKQFRSILMMLIMVLRAERVENRKLVEILIIVPLGPRTFGRTSFRIFPFGGCSFLLLNSSCYTSYFRRNTFTSEINNDVPTRTGTVFYVYCISLSSCYRTISTIGG